MKNNQYSSHTNQKTKKSQITIFIILGVVILTAIGLYIYFKASVTDLKLEPEMEATREIPEQINPVKLYVDSYIKEKTHTAIDILEMHGGYIEYDQLKTNKFQPTEGNAIEFIPDTGDKLPYWNYLESRNTCTDDCIFASEMPPLCKPDGRTCISFGQNSIQEQLENYIGKEVENLELSKLEQDGFQITPLSKPKLRVTIRDKDVVIYVNYPLKIKTADTEYKLDEFQVITKTSLSELYEVAKKITDYESKNCFMGDYVRKVYVPAFYWAGEDNPQKDLPPISETTIGQFTTKFWTLPDVKEKLKAEISKGVSMIGILNTANLRIPSEDCDKPENKLRCGLYYQQIFQPLDKEYNVKVFLSYNPLYHDIYLDIQPRNGNILMPKEFSSPIDLFRSMTLTKIYEFSYDYSFPVIAELRAPSTETGNKEEVFRFALESNIRANNCYNTIIPIISPVSIGDDLTCDSVFGTNKLSLTVTEQDNVPIENADVSYFAGTGICPSVFTDSNGMAEINYPTAGDILFLINKDDYIGKRIRPQGTSLINGLVTAEPKNILSETTTLTSILEKEIEFRLLPINLVESFSDSPDAIALRENNYEKITEEYSALLELTRKSSDDEDDFSTTIYYDRGKFLPEKLRIAPGKYDLSIQLFLNKEVIIPEEKNMMCVDSETVESVGSSVAGGTTAVLACSGTMPLAPACAVILSTIVNKIANPIIGHFFKCEKKPVNESCQYPGPTIEDFEKGNCYKKGYYCDGNDCKIKQDISTPETNLGDSVPLGGIILEDIEITSADLKKDKAIFYIIKQNIPTRMWHLREMNKYEELSKSARNILLPEFE